MTATLLRGISELVTNDPELGAAPIGLITNAALIMQDGRVEWLGTERAAPAADRSVDLAGRAVLPGWVDSHSHSIHGGGPSIDVWATVDATRAAGDHDLLVAARRRRAQMLLGGTTCAETATGYGLTVLDERRSVLTAAAAGFDEIAFLGAHVVPAEFANDPDGYVDLVCGPMLDAVAADVHWIDVYCDEGAFDEAQSRRLLAAGQRKGLGLRVHGNRSGAGAAVRIAVDVGAASVDHCTHLGPADVDALASSATVATLLPAADLSAGQPPAPARELLDAGVRIALASGCGPASGTSSMNLVVALGVLQCGLTVAEAVYAATAGGAESLRRADVGHLAVGARADIQVLDAPGYADLVHRIGMPLTHSVFRHGVQLGS